MYYRHDLNYEYPERSDEHMIKVKRVRETNFDANYEYWNRSLGFKLLRGVYWTLVTGIVFPLMRITHGLRIHGKENLKKHKKALANGAITISNHVFYWDYLCVLKAIRPHLAYFPAWKDNFEGSGGPWIRLSGGIPVPTDNLRAMMRFNRTMEALMESGKWVHFFPEGSMWLFYPDIRPLKKAVFTYAVKYNKPIVPITMSFRPRRGFMRIFSKKPRVDMNIGEPLFPNPDLPRREAERELHEKAYHVMQVMNGITPDSPNYRTDQDISRYQKTM